MNRRGLIVAGFGCVGVLGAWFMLFWSPAGTDLAEAKERVVEAETEVEQLEVRLAQLLDAQDRWDELTAVSGQLSKAVPAEPGLADFLLDAHAIAEEADVEFLEIFPSPPEASVVPGVGGEIRLSIRVDGGYFHILDYLAALLDLERIVVLEKVSINPGGAGPQDGALSVTVSGRMFTSEAPGSVPTEESLPPAPGSTTPTTSVPDTVAAGGATSEGGA